MWCRQARSGLVLGSSRTADIIGRSADVQLIGPIKRNEQCSDNEETHEQHPNRRACWKEESVDEAVLQSNNLLS